MWVHQRVYVQCILLGSAKACAFQGRGPPTSVFTRGGRSPMTRLGSWGCGARRATASGVTESVRSGPTVLLAKQPGYGRTGDDKGMGICNYTNESCWCCNCRFGQVHESCYLPVLLGGGDSVCGMRVRMCACPVCWEDGSHSVPRVWRDAWCRGVGLFTSVSCRPHVPETF